jgi:hypothetical protein
MSQYDGSRCSIIGFISWLVLVTIGRQELAKPKGPCSKLAKCSDAGREGERYALALCVVQLSSGSRHP